MQHGSKSAASKVAAVGTSALSKVTTLRRRDWPEESASALSRWTYWYLNPLLAKGAQQKNSDNDEAAQQLAPEDLFAVPTSMECARLSRNFATSYQQHEQSVRHRLLWTLWDVAAPSFVPAGVWQLITVLCQVGMPLLVRQLLVLLEQHPNERIVRQGVGYVLGLFAVLVVNGVGNHRYRHLSMKAGVTMRAALVGVLYQHVLRLTPHGRRGLTSGAVSNLVAVDTQKIFEVAQDVHLLWALPLSIALVMALLLWIQGPTTLVGIAVMVAFVPVVQFITARMQHIRQQRVTKTDLRIEIVNSFLQGIKVAKLNNYERQYRQRIADARQAELRLLSQELAVWAFTMVAARFSSVLATAAAFAAYVLVSGKNILTASDTFSVLLLFSALRFPINYAGRLIGNAAQALSAMRRINAFLERDARSVLNKHKVFDRKGNVNGAESERDANDGNDSKTCLRLENAAFSVDPYVSKSTLHSNTDGDIARASLGTAFTVSNFTLSVKRGEVVAVVGPVASGKTTLVLGILDEVTRLPGTHVTIRGRVSYVPQSPFVLNTTLRDNILFGLPYDREHYERVLNACALRPDIEQLGTVGDLTEIGERGVTLSGGQKQRVSLARAAYARPDLILLDDPLSALDAGTAKSVFECLIRSPNAFLCDSAVVLVTHAAHFLNRVDRILLVVDGSNEFLGTWRELASLQPTKSTTRSAIDFIRISVLQGEGDEEELLQERSSATEQAKGNEKLMTLEQREHGLSTIKTWLLWFRRAGGTSFMALQVVLMALDRFLYVGVEWWLARWTEGAESPIQVWGLTFDAQIDGRSAQFGYLKVFSSILLASVVVMAVRSQWVVTGGRRAAQHVFDAMVDRVLYAPVSYFETTPMGRVLNRFTYDMEVIDILLSENMSMFIVSSSWYVAGVILICTVLPWTALAMFPITVAYWRLMLHYRKSGSDLQRLDAVSRSPIQAMVSEALDGAATIRVLQQDETFLERFHQSVNDNSAALLNFVTAQRWLGVRIGCLGALIVLVCTMLVISINEILHLAPGIVGLLINWAANFTILLNFLVDSFAEAEASITAIERVDAMSLLPQESPMTTKESAKPDDEWPRSGRLEFRSVCLRYREGLPLALNNLSFVIPSGKTCGIVGRTGAGKSSLSVAMFRLVEIESGVILLDGVDLAALGLSNVRGRPNGMAIIPQDPFLTGTTLRECLDPFSTCSDDSVLHALRSVRLATSDDDMSQLNSKVEEGGANFSVGERQLLNLARALLSQPRLLMLDEATASVDGETDALLQQMLRTQFPNTTLITVAHRLNTIMDYDVVLVMADGRAVEFGSPAELLDHGGTFADLVDATGSQGSNALRRMVK